MDASTRINRQRVQHHHRHYRLDRFTLTTRMATAFRRHRPKEKSEKWPGETENAIWPVLCSYFNVLFFSFLLFPFLHQTILLHCFGHQLCNIFSYIWSDCLHWWCGHQTISIATGKFTYFLKRNSCDWGITCQMRVQCKCLLNSYQR